jgi:hypothetical protein
MEKRTTTRINSTEVLLLLQHQMFGHCLINMWVCGYSLAGSASLNSSGDMDTCLVYCVLCVVSQSLRRAVPSSRGVLPTVVCHCM